MTEIAATRGSNGLRFVSTFSGCGGSCLGFEMAGWLPVYACEFIDEARATYEQNHHGVFVDGRDIRLVTPEDILGRTGLAVGELDLLEGSPPCSSFSMAGNREGGWDKVKKYSDKEQRTDDLFFEFARLLRGLQPRAFVAENVMGLVRGTAKGYFKMIVAELSACGYDIEARALDASWLGVPQARQRIIFVGVRRDLARPPVYPDPLPFHYSVADAIDDLRGYVAPDAPENDGPSLVGYALYPEWKKLIPGNQSRRYFNLVRPDRRRPLPTVTALGGSNPGTASVTHPTEPRKFTIAELKRLCGFPDDFVLTGSYAQQWERLGRAVPPVMMSHVARAIAQGVFDR